MTKHTSETLESICNTMAGGTLSIAKLARAHNLTSATIWNWLNKSKLSAPDDPAWTVTFGATTMKFDQAMAAAHKIVLHEARALWETSMLRGRDEKIFFQGRPQWREDESLAKFTDEEVRELLSLPDRYERDENGNRIQLTIHHPPPMQGIIKLVESNFRVYRPRSEVAIDQKIALGVTRVRDKPAALPAPASAPEPDDDDLDLADILGPAPVSAPEPDDEDDDLSEPDQVEVQPEPVPVASVLRPDLQALLDTYRQGPKNPRPNGPVNTGNGGSRFDDPPERSG